MSGNRADDRMWKRRIDKQRDARRLHKDKYADKAPRDSKETDRDKR